MADDDWDTDPDFVSDVNIKKGKSEKSTLIATNTRDLAQIVKTEAQKDSQTRVIQGDYRKGGRVSDMSNDRSKQQVFVAPAPPARNPQVARETRVWGKDDAATVQKQIQSQVAPAPKPAPAPAPKPAAAPKPAPAPAPAPASKPAPPPPAAKPAPPPAAAKPAPPPEPEPAASEWDQGGYDQGGYDQGGYDYDQGGYDQGGYDQGGYDQGGYDQGGYDQGAGGGGYQARALYDFAGETETDLPFYAGDVISVIDTSDPGGWWEGELNGARGFFPSNFVEYI